MSEVFDPTSWNKIRRAAHSDGRDQEDALNHLARIYRNPLLTLARRTGIPENDVEDMVQCVLAKAISPEKLAGRDPAKGKFRQWLTTLLTNEWRSQLRQRRRQCRDERRTHSLAEASLAHAKAVDIARVIDQEHAVECVKSVKMELFGEWGDDGEAQALWVEMLQMPPDAAVAEKKPSPGHLRRFKRRFLEKLKRRARATVTDPADLDAECKDLLDLGLRANR